MADDDGHGHGRRLTQAAADDEETLHTLEGEANHALEMNCTLVHSGETIIVKEDYCSTLVFDDSMFQSIFKIDTTGTTGIAIFAEHYPSEFELDSHYLRDDHGDDIEAVHELPEIVVPVIVRPWGIVIGTCLFVNLATLSGVVFLTPGVAHLRKKHSVAFDILTSAFAAGALLATAFYLLLFESAEMIMGGYDDEVEAIWRWGTLVLAGYLSPIAMATAVNAIAGSLDLHGHAEGSKVTPSTDNKAPADEQADFDKVVASADKKDVEEMRPLSARIRVITGVMVGDFMHNFVDGILIATAFMKCGNAFAWALIAATIGHEIAQELGDFCILTTHGQLTSSKALLVNFFAGTSVVFGAIAVMAVEGIASKDIGMILAYGGGTYMYIGTTECMGRIIQTEHTISLRLKLGYLAAFVVGAIAIGLVLLGDEHCVAEGGDPHGGH